MKVIKKIIITVLLIVFMVTSSNVLDISNPVVAQAATIKISQKSLTLEVGQSKTLSVKSTTKKVTWSSSKKTIATVSSKGKVTAKSVGKTTITASVSGKKYTCAVTVNEAANPYLKDAPFKATEQKIGNISLVLPADWTLTNTAATETGLTYMLTSNDTSLKSFVQLDIGMVDDIAVDYKIMKQGFSATFTEDYFKQLWSDQLSVTDVVISNLTQDDMNASFGYVFRTDYTLSASGVTAQHVIYDTFIDNYFLQLQVFDFNGIDLKSMAEYVIGSIIIK